MLAIRLAIRSVATNLGYGAPLFSAFSRGVDPSRIATVENLFHF
ncbi:hypothetical protein RR11_2080 [Ruegeria sp. R11]|nr:hypothetical protein RR11_2080 [Ruegeria sp. R11]